QITTTTTHTTRSTPGAAHVPARRPAVYAATKHAVNLTWIAHVTARHGWTYIEHGSVTGPPIGSATVILQARLTASGVTTLFTIGGSGGSITGRSETAVHLSSGSVLYRGTASLNGGTGRYRHLRLSQLTVTGKGNLKGSQTVLILAGSASY
ncbi:MAG: hypothetical protein WBQ18_08765, partial [Solirubrobacteraceae bacterium]